MMRQDNPQLVLVGYVAIRQLLIGLLLPRVQTPTSVLGILGSVTK